MNYYFLEDNLYIKNKMRADKVNDALIFIKDDWDDYGYKTEFMSIIVSNLDSTENNFGINIVNIGIVDENIHNIFANLKDRGLINKKLDKFPDDLFTLGNFDYYSNLKEHFKSDVLVSIYEDTKDISYSRNLNILRNVKPTEMYKISFLRKKTKYDIDRIINYVNEGNSSNYNNLEINLIDRNNEIHNINLSNNKNSPFSSNIFAIIGNNGVGKTTLLEDIVMSVNSFGSYINSNLKNFNKIKINSNNNVISHTVFITYSQFDVFENDFIDLFEKSDNNDEHKFKLVSNRQTKSNGYVNEDKYDNYNKIVSTKKFSNKLENSLESAFLNNNKLFEEVLNYLDFSEEIMEFINKIKLSTFTSAREEIIQNLSFYTKKLSSGQKIILSIIANLIENANSNSLFLIDEPESHLHPPFLLSLILAIDHITKITSSICLISTHSSITIQELESNNVFIINNLNIINPDIQTFATNSQKINDYIFGLDIRSTGYYRKIKEFVDDNSNKKINETIFNGKLSDNAIILMSAFKE